MTVDDALQDITDVVRGQDLFAATAVHRLLQTLLGLPEPRYRHHRLILDSDGRKLSKSSRSTGLRELRAQGMTSADIRRMVGLAVHAARSDRMMLLLGFLLLTVLTQVGGIILVFAWLIGRLMFPKTLQGWRRGAALTVLFLILYQAVSSLVVPPLAVSAGRVPLPCHAEPDRPFAAASGLYCLLNRHYVDPRVLALLTELSRAVDRAYPGTTTLYLDANFPFLDGFPLLPHLSHDDGRKLDLAYYYATPTGSYLLGTLRSPIGYWAFEQPAAGDASSCGARPWLTLRWDLNSLQSLYSERPLERERTAAALRWLTSEGQAFGVERAFIEPYLANRLGVSSPVLGFQGCRAARHDDHIHIQIGRRNK